MKAKSFVAALGLVLALGVGGVSAWAQKVDVKIPFKFAVDGKEFPAGDYQIKYDRASSNQLLLRSLEDNDAGDVVTSSRSGNAADARPPPR